jgi:uncharacterized membrane protein
VIALLLLPAVTLLLLGAAAWAMPAFTQPTLPFGVRIPRERAAEPAVATVLRPYRTRVAVNSTGVTAAATAVLATTGHNGLADAVALPCAVLLLVGLNWAAYYRAHRTIASAKSAGSWYEGVPQGVAVDTSLRTRPERFPWLWLLPALLITLGTAVTGAIRYPTLPARLATHWNAAGHADGHARTSIPVAFIPVILQLVNGVLLAGTAAFALRSRQLLDAERPRASAVQHRGFVRWTARGLLVLAACVDLSLLGTALMTWQVVSYGAVAATVVALPLLLGSSGALAIAVRTGAQGSRLAVRDDDGQAQIANRDDDRFWKAGVLYVNRDDSSVFVPKRFGIGWTVNMGHPAGVLALLLLIAVPVGVAAALTR